VDKVSEEEMKRLEEAAEESGGVYDEVEIEDLEWNDGDSTFYYPCPCGDKFQVRD
jgi:diphthamide biosynthesis protein 3